MNEATREQAKATSEEKTRLIRPIKLTGEQRAGSVLVGLGLLGAGGWGYIASGHDGAGTVAFVTAGTLAGLLGVIGRVPTKLTGKDYGLEMIEEEVKERVDAEVSEIVDDLSTSAKKEIVAAAVPVTLPDVNPTVASDEALEDLRSTLAKHRVHSVARDSAAKSLAFERQVLAALDEALKVYNDSYVLQEQVFGGVVPLDASIELWDGTMVGVEIKARRHSLDEAAIIARDLMKQLPRGFKRVMVVTESSVAIADARGAYGAPGYPTQKLLEVALQMAIPTHKRGENQP
ncbi:hypothetical protein [Terrabacter sp. 2RAF25]|uniref:hypothetical protein n=1 Tax=Terrabacter sp. 2RAF25 TaxID=3232998 RepID=UPI003F9E76FB